MTRHQTPARPRAIALLAGVALLASLVAAPVVVANGVTTRYVGPGGGTGGCLTPTYGTIADAVSAASTGDTIHTCADTYNLTAPITIGTFSAHTGEVGGAILTDTGDVTVTNSIPAQSSSATSNCDGMISDNGGNLSTDASCGFNTTPPQAYGISRVIEWGAFHVGPLQDDGGPHANDRPRGRERRDRRGPRRRLQCGPGERG